MPGFRRSIDESGGYSSLGSFRHKTNGPHCTRQNWKLCNKDKKIHSNCNHRHCAWRRKPSRGSFDPLVRRQMASKERAPICVQRAALTSLQTVAQ
jgi:hypothetical protein